MTLFELRQGKQPANMIGQVGWLAQEKILWVKRFGETSEVMNQSRRAEIKCYWREKLLRGYSI